MTSVDGTAREHEVGAERSAPQRVLVVDDEKDIRELLALELSLAGFEVEAVDSGEKAVEAVRHRPHRLVITDYRMPGMDGIETLRALLRIDPSLRIVVMTAYASAEVLEASRNAGVFACIRKPFDLDELQRVIRAALAE